jgi:ABC-2 type transport system ATP-binding protein
MAEGVPMLRVEGLAKSFVTRTGRVAAVNGVSFEVNAGEVLAFLGPNGAGKTTTIKMTAGLIEPDAGAVWIAGRSLCRDHDAATAQVGAVLEGSRNLYWRLTPLENLEYWAAMRRMPIGEARRRAVELLELVGLSSRARNTVQTLSRGMQQKVALCQALMHRPRVLLLDEPTLGLDLESGEGIKKVVRDLAQAGTAVLLTTHQLDVAQDLADRVAMIRGGSLALSGTTAEVLARFSQLMVTVEAAVPWPDDLAERLDGLPAAIAGSTTLTIDLRDDGDPVLYQVLDRLKPHPLLRVERHRADLVEVFQRVMGGFEDAGAAREAVSR